MSATRWIPSVDKSNILGEANGQRVIPLGRLGWPLRRIQKENRCIPDFPKLDIDPARVQAQWFHVVALREPSPQMELARTLLTLSGSNRITAA